MFTPNKQMATIIRNLSPVINSINLHYTLVPIDEKFPSHLAIKGSITVHYGYFTVYQCPLTRLGERVLKSKPAL